MHRILKKDQILTIPNLLSLIRLLMIPLIIWLYCEAQQYGLAVIVILLSGLTDIVDGFIARKYHMVSDFGKILDPTADKLTQAALILCLSVRYQLMVPLIITFAIRELFMIIMGYITIKKYHQVNSAQWYGKVTTIVLYTVMTLLILFPGIPELTANTMILFCGVVMLVTFVLYAKFYISVWREDDVIGQRKS